MKCQSLFSGKNKKNISKCRPLKFLPRVLSVKCQDDILKFFCFKISLDISCESSAKQFHQEISKMPIIFGQKKMPFSGVVHIFGYMPATTASVAQFNAHPTGDQEVAGSTPAGSAHFFVEIDHEVFSMVILSHTLIQEGQFSVPGERMCTILVKHLED